MRIIASGEILAYESRTQSGQTTLGSLTATVPPYCTTDTKVTPTRCVTGGVVPGKEFSVKDELPAFDQGVAFYRNEKSVSHAKSTASIIMSPVCAPHLGLDMKVPWHRQNYGTDYYGCDVYIGIPFPSSIALGPFEQGISFTMIRWGPVYCKHGIPYKQDNTEYSTRGCIINTQTKKIRPVYFKTVNLGSKKHDCVQDAIDNLSNVSAAPSGLGSYMSPTVYKFDSSETDFTTVVDSVRSKQRVVMAQLRNALGISSWAHDSAHLVSSAYKARGRVAMDLADQVGRLTNNNVALCMELAQLLKEVITLCRGNPSGLRTLLRDIRNVRDAKQAAKLIANCRLSEQYGIRLTVRDVLEVADAIRRISTGEKIARASCVYSCPFPSGTAVVAEHWKMFYSASPTNASAIAKLYLSDLVGLGNVWDLIPYSFVVDWFVPVGEILQGWDDEAMLSHLPINQIVLGRKSTFSDSWSESGAMINMQASYYERRPVSSFPPSFVSTSHSVNTTTVLNGAALIVQRL